MASVFESAARAALTPVLTGLASFNRRRLPSPDRNPFLHGIHAPLEAEQTFTNLKVTGTIPPQLDGQYVRIGPNPFGEHERGHHWFVGDGMVHGVKLQGGHVQWYRNRFIRSRDLARRGGPDAAGGPRRGFSDTVNTNVLRIGGDVMALVEAGSFPVALDDDLETRAYSDFSGGLTGSYTAHPHEDPRTGELHAICYDGAIADTLRHVVIDKTGKVLRETPVPVRHGPSVHDCGLTDRYVLVFDLPVCFSMKALIEGHRFPYRWKPDHQARVGLLPREGTGDQIVWCDVDPAFVFHIGNSFDMADGKVAVDVCAYETMFDGPMVGPFGKGRGLERWIIDPAGRTVRCETLDGRAQEFPRPDERRFCSDYRYLWCIGIPGDGKLDFHETLPLLRHDLTSGETITREFGGGRVPGEFVFVPREADAPEGDGWVMGYVVDPAKDETTLEICDAMTLDTVAAVHIPHRIPPGFHGNWLPA
ncbi:carotenoid oxygenase family protein [Aurantiacibacter sp. MUD11]|uniref:8'-apo-carotenoid 13,14-cleaving dioxygenase n=1 Tax=Aurantiacibacter sp. MUD11 TaxID=3003265 RepID=UPI0022AAFF57|nr:carotenoid oxygenase family protein [Aurantiacibacter sp. MUD11]WAT18268.1 carotenoid oxygenase family protein [Aurantiacibacter sp. MUD11]